MVAASGQRQASSGEGRGYSVHGPPVGGCGQGSGLGVGAAYAACASADGLRGCGDGGGAGSGGAGARPYRRGNATFGNSCANQGSPQASGATVAGSGALAGNTGQLPLDLPRNHCGNSGLTCDTTEAINTALDEAEHEGPSVLTPLIVPVVNGA
ncbi:chaplin [Streptomyces halobius]|uniref:Chaplin n=1 Tax=Streptomyces halobius TaxID=2879846 RepID=A0ABY4MK14_9ACTN|nr:chaplin [Streptomyces halobius]